MLELTILAVPAFSDLANAAFALRREVFVLEQKVPASEENDGDDLTATHFVAVAQGDVVATLRLLDKPEHVKIGRVAVRSVWRGQGVARRLMLAAMDHARAAGRNRFYLTAQTDKVAMYEKLGFVSYGPVFQDGGMPHLAMRTYALEELSAP
jgi:predicted GNAT family N-acyltransferase